MRELALRRLHRHIAVVVAPLVVIQATSGLFLTLATFGRIHRRVRDLLADHELSSLVALWDYLLLEVHFGGGTMGTLYNMFVAVGLLVLTATGILVFVKVLVRSSPKFGQGIPGEECSAVHAAASQMRLSVWFGRRRVFLLVVSCIAGLLGLSIYVFYGAYRMSALYVPLIHAASRVQIEATRAHVLLEEVLAGDTEARAGDVWGGVERAEQYVEAILHGSVTRETDVLPLEEVGLRRRVIGIGHSLDRLRELTSRRLAGGMHAGPGSQVEQEYDRVFDGFARSSQEVEETLLGVVREERQRFLTHNVLLVFGASLLVLAICLVFHRFEAERSRHLILVQEARTRAEEGEQLFRQVVHQTADCFLVFKANGRVLDANRVACAWFGYSRDEILAATVEDLALARDGEELLRTWQRMAPEAPASFRCRFVKRDGVECTVIANIGLLRWKGEDLLLCLARDERSV